MSRNWQRWCPERPFPLGARAFAYALKVGEDIHADWIKITADRAFALGVADPKQWLLSVLGEGVARTLSRLGLQTAPMAFLWSQEETGEGLYEAAREVLKEAS